MQLFFFYVSGTKMNSIPGKICTKKGCRQTTTSHILLRNNILKLFMISLLHDIPVLHDKDQIRIADR